TRIVKVDMKEGSIYFTARREVSTRNDVYKVSLKTKQITRLSFGEYNFTGVSISPDNKHFIAQYSNSVTPTRLAVVSIGKKPVEKVIADSKGEKFDEYKLAIPEMLSITVDGYVLPAQVIWPLDLDSTKKYPVLVSMYGGPNAGTVMDTWKGINEKNQWWANEGVIQIAIDHRASGHCGKEGLNFLHRNLLNIELVDYIEWIKELHKRPFVNRDKVGITGFSYGGSMTMLACTAGNDYFKYGIAGGGVYDWGLYDSHYTERYMDHPKDNPDGYANTRMMLKVDRYKGDSTNYVKITHGTSDDNVHMQNTMQLIGALQDAGKQFDLMMYPGEFHGYRGKKSFHSTTGDYIFWYKHLLDKDAPKVLLDAKQPK
ncbi:MAG: S9 family peptidase, partial [Bacteroidales bacterium]|nr:S9 family peptidase [Bacteroidales bacterium]